MNKMINIAFILLILSVVIGAVAQISLKKGVSNLQGKYDTLEILNPVKFLSILKESPLIFVGGLLYALGFVIWIAAMTKFDVSFMYPMLSLAYILVAVLAFVILKENITLYRWLGIILVTIGSMLLLKSA
jgi:uncharacterized membrane protein